MPKLSRRKLLSGAIAAPLAAPTFLPTAGAISQPRLIVDPLATGAAEWIAADKHLTAIEMKWQDLESLLFAKAKRVKMSCLKARHSNMPEAMAMRALDVEIEETDQRLKVAAGAISLMPATTIAGAIAKIELGLKVQGPFDWRDHALELLEGGIAELRHLVMISGE